MDYIIVISMILIFSLGYKLIDIVFNNATFSKESNEGTFIKAKENVLLYTNESKNEEIETFLSSKLLNCIYLNELSYLDTSKEYSYLIAASQSDLDNLTICTIYSKKPELKKLVALCNSPQNKRFYEEAHIPYLIGSNLSLFFVATYLIS